MNKDTNNIKGHISNTEIGSLFVWEDKSRKMCKILMTTNPIEFEITDELYNDVVEYGQPTTLKYEIENDSYKHI
jgi:hypothetical protein